MEKGIVEKATRKAWDFGKNNLQKVGNKLSPFKQGTEETVQEASNTSSNNHNTNNTQTADDSVLNKPPHNQSPLNNVDNSINDGAKNVK